MFKLVDSIQQRQEENFLGVGWAFPVTFSAGNYQLQISAYEKNINSSIDVILLTRKGERSLAPDFGAGLQQFFFNKMDETLLGRISDAIKTSLRRNEPRITVLDVKSFFTDMINGLVEVKIVYEYNQTNTRHNYVFPFSVKEGTSLPG